jgi:hypothetical protein
LRSVSDLEHIFQGAAPQADELEDTPMFVDEQFR